MKREIRRKASLELAEPGIGYDGAQDGRQVAQRHKRVVDGGGEILIKVQEVVQVKHQHGCGVGGGHKVNVVGGGHSVNEAIDNNKIQLS